MRRLARILAAGLMALGMVGGLLGAAEASGPRPVVVGRIEGVINPITARYVERVIRSAEERRAAAVVFTIDTPGGLINPTYQISAMFLNANVPIVVHVSPSGAHAASAGTFITMAAHVAAMAPATNIGAAHPVAAGGADIGGDARQKAENDAVARITAIARARGRDEAWAESAVRRSVSATDDEAVRLRVVDLVARDLPDLLERIHGREVALPSGAVRLETRGAPVSEDPRNIFETLLHVITDPQVASLLFTFGMLGIYFELTNPGGFFPGVVGVVSIVLALFAFGTLDANAAGIALLLFALVLFGAEILVAGHGILTAGGVAALLLGLVILFPGTRPTFPGVRYTIEPWTIALIVGSVGLYVGLLARTMLRTRRLPVKVGRDLTGTRGVVRAALAPRGIVHVDGEEWTAETEGGPIPVGATVRVWRVEGLRLIVEPEPAEGKGS